MRIMNFSKIIKLSFYSLLCLQRVSCSDNSVSKRDTLSNGTVDDILEKFFVELKKAYLWKLKLRHITFVGAGGDDLRQSRPLLESYPYIICKDTVKCGYSNVFSRGSFVVFFLEDLRKDTFAQKYKFLLQCRRCKILFISDENIQVDEIRLIFTLAMGKNVQYIEFANLKRNIIKLYTNFFGKSCSVEVRLIAVWRPGIRLDKIHTWAFKLQRDLSGCPVSISSLNIPPKMMIEQKSNGSLEIVGGREGKLLLTLAEKLNFTLAVRYPTVVDRMKYSQKMSIINDVISGVVEVGVGRILPTNDLHEILAFSISYDEECVTWGVPLVINWPHDILWVEFSWQVWIPVGLVFAVTCAIVYVDQIFDSSKEGKRRNSGFVAIVLDELSVSLGNSVIYKSSSARGRFMLIIYLYYATVITTAYKSSLAAILATNGGTPLYVNAEEIIKGNITVGGSLYDYKILQEQVNASEFTPKLLERFAINNDDAETTHRLKYHHDYAFLARLSYLNYEKQKMVRDQEPLSFDTLSDCVLDYYTVIVFKKISFLRKPTNNMIKRLREAGVLKHWDLDEMYHDEEIFKGGNSGKYSENSTSNKFLTIFFLYSVCIALSSIIFLIELMSEKFNPRKRQNHPGYPGPAQYPKTKSMIDFDVNRIHFNHFSSNL